MKINSQERVVKELLKILSELNLERKKGIHEPYFNKKESVYVQKSVSSTYVSTVGDFIKKFESEIKKFTLKHKTSFKKQKILEHLLKFGMDRVN